MTKVPVNVPNFASNMMYGTAKVQNTDTNGDFSKIFESQKSANSEVKTQETTAQKADTQSQDDAVEAVESKEPVATEVKETKNTDTVKEASKAQEGQSADGETEEGEVSEEVLNQVMAVLQEAVTDIKTVLAQELGISEEELDGLMESMNIGEMDLMDMSTLKELVLQANGADDMMALLTDESLYAQMQSLEGNFEEIMSTVQETLQLTDEEMRALNEQISNLSKAEPVVTVETADAAMSVVEETKPQEDASSAKEDGGNANAFLTGNQNTFQGQQTTVTGEVTTSQTTTFASAETENIMNQIMDYMKVQLDADTSTLEMQLQPESLGTLQIRISAKEGIMTAQFTTASETVKAALESQMVQLQQQFENQNIKVDAIEVTVQTHQFESALQQGEERQQAQEGKKSRPRRIDLSRLEETEEMQEDDRIVAEMMAANGNTVDYLA